MWSSFDRTLANGDSAGFIRRLDDGRYVLAEMDGPGAIVRIWSAEPRGKLQIIIDGGEQPLFDDEFANLFGGDTPPFLKPFVYVKDDQEAGGRYYHWSYAPIPYRRSCLVLCSSVCFYQFTYVTFPPGTAVTPLPQPPGQAEIQALGESARRFTEIGRPPVVGRLERLAITATAAEGESVSLAELEGPAIIRGVRLKWPDLDPQQGRTASIEFRWDDEQAPSILAPIHDFLGGSFRTLMIGTDDEGYGYNYYPMPFRERAAMSLVNGGDEPLSIGGELLLERGVELPGDLRTFHAWWNREIEATPAVVRSRDRVTNPICDPDENYLVADIRGEGHYVGTMHHRFGGSEGDEYVFVDGEGPPGSSPGTGNEDYFDMAWGPKTMDGPLAGGASVLGRAGCFRAHLADAIAFDQSLQFGFEVFCANTARYDYDSVAFWYQIEPHRPMATPLPPRARRFRTGPNAVDPRYTHTWDETEQAWVGMPHLPAEGEDLTVVRSDGPEPRVEEMLPVGPDWSGGKQLAADLRPGQGFTVALPPADYTGWHSLTIALTTGDAYGQVALTTDAPSRLRPIAAREAAPVQFARTGVIFRQPGDGATLTLTLREDGSDGGKGRIGLDWLRLEPAEGVALPLEVAPAAAAGEATDEPKWRAVPPLPPPTPDQRAEAARLRRALPPPGAVGLDGLEDGDSIALRAHLSVERGGIYRLDWQGTGPVPVEVLVNGRATALDPRRYSFPSLRGEYPRRYPVPLRAGENELRWVVRPQKGAWIAPTPYGTEPPPEGVFEAEDLEIRASSGEPLGLQRLPVGRGQWSGNGHLWFRPGGTGAYFELVVPVVEGGDREILCDLTRAYNYGIFELTVDGRSVGGPFDGYHGLAPGDRTVLHAPRVSFGTINLARGDHVFRFEVTGKNKDSRGYMVGVDRILLETPAE